jgi:hypothetical protein
MHGMTGLLHLLIADQYTPTFFALQHLILPPAPLHSVTPVGYLLTLHINLALVECNIVLYLLKSLLWLRIIPRCVLELRFPSIDGII